MPQVLTRHDLYHRLDQAIEGVPMGGKTTIGSWLYDRAVDFINDENERLFGTERPESGKLRYKYRNLLRGPSPENLYYGKD